MKHLLSRLLPMIFGLILLFSCKSEAEKAAERRALIDSTVASFRKNLLRAELDSVVQQNRFNGSVAVYQDGKAVYQRQAGFGDFKTGTRLDSATVFAVGSISKQFTAALVLQLAEAGRLSTESRASEFLPEFRRKEFEKITVGQLLSHSSGLNDYGEKLLATPGKEFNYSNRGYRFLGKIIEKISGKSYDENAMALFRKAGMAHSGTANIFDGKDFAGANLGNEKQHAAVENMPRRLASADISVAAGGILSTTADLDRWNRALYGGKILKPETLRRMTHPAFTRPHYVLGTVGYGYGIMTNLGAPRAYFHTGYVKGSPSLLVYYPESRSSVVVLSNIADESRGKEEFFRPHAQVKNATDAVEIATEGVNLEFKKSKK